jgi:hypothetical protein
LRDNVAQLREDVEEVVRVLGLDLVEVFDGLVAMIASSVFTSVPPRSVTIKIDPPASI